MIAVLLIAMAVAFMGGLIVGVVATERHYSDLARMQAIRTLQLRSAARRARGEEGW